MKGTFSSYLDFGVLDISFGVHIFPVSLRLLSGEEVRYLSIGHFGHAAEVACRVAVIGDDCEPACGGIKNTLIIRYKISLIVNIQRNKMI